MTGEEFGRLRRELGISQEAAAEALGVKRTTVQRWEYGAAYGKNGRRGGHLGIPSGAAEWILGKAVGHNSRAGP